MRRPEEGDRPKRRWGQNFLVNEGAADTLVRAFLPRPADHVLEIGPGRGVLTRRLAGRVARLVAVEIDPALASSLAASLPDSPLPGSLEVIEGDVLAIEPALLLERLDATPERPGRVIANLPYNIATTVILRLLTLRPRLADMMVMVQREVAGRIAARPRSKAYGSLSILCQTFARVDSILRLGPGSFHPRPRVDSEVIRLILRDPGGAAGRDFEGYAALVRAAFAARRKTVSNNLAHLRAPGGTLGHAGASDLLRSAGIEPGMRGEEITAERFQALFAAWQESRGL
ncbi:MAG TPA: 16S rRNA (adenine(1518)-N(6)/adenine(1519)-N(6))-dimethyltransferase RsmA [Patescibacteria group bacterium]|nr:16S rRNA (adenine(1518)-N(6)/adenine(1519)-N(6))-dimethyltransferase RsmA [Patescibacteria group bacterium]